MKIKAQRYLGLGFGGEEEAETETVYARVKFTRTEFTRVDVLCVDLG